VPHTPTPPSQLLLGRLADRAVAFSADRIERIVRMVALTPLPGAAPGVAGVINVRGEAVPVVDPRPWLGLPSPAPHPDQHLVLLTAQNRYALWLDRVERIVTPRPDDLIAVEGQTEGVAPQLARVDQALVPVLSLVALDPGPLLSAANAGSVPVPT
jgi:chemotaxis signal transduction protein